MIRLGHSDLNAEVAATLSAIQAKVDALPTFALRAKKAQSLWESKGGVAGKMAFESVKVALNGLCVYEGVCNYCEQNEASDIEHIYPKSFFPEYAFVWENYLLACKHCNSTFKLDKVHVLDANDDLVLLERKQVPPSEVVAFINPRLEDPSVYFELNTSSYTFELRDGLDKAKRHKGSATLEILELNGRDTLIKARQSAGRHYYWALRELVELMGVQDVDELKGKLAPDDHKLFDFNLSLEVLKEDIRQSRRRYISSYQHPSVWRAIKEVEAKVDPNWRKLFEALPEALGW